MCLDLPTQGRMSKAKQYKSSHPKFEPIELICNLSTPLREEFYNFDRVTNK
jgi:hypothetical protein